MRTFTPLRWYCELPIRCFFTAAAGGPHFSYYNSTHLDGGTTTLFIPIAIAAFMSVPAALVRFAADMPRCRRIGCSYIYRSNAADRRMPSAPSVTMHPLPAVTLNFPGTAATTSTTAAALHSLLLTHTSYTSSSDKITTLLAAIAARSIIGVH